MRLNRFNSSGLLGFLRVVLVLAFGLLNLIRLWLEDLGAYVSNSFNFHSLLHFSDPELIFLTDGVSKGVMQILNVIIRNQNDGSVDEIFKVASIALSPNVPAQIFLGLMVNPPQPRDISYLKYDQERYIHLSLVKFRSELMSYASKFLSHAEGLRGPLCVLMSCASKLTGVS